MNSSGTKPFFIVCARDGRNVKEKIFELEQMDVPFLVVCGEEISHPNVVYRKAMGKWDAINFGAQFIPKDANVVAFNDVDTKMHNPEKAFECLTLQSDLVYCKVNVSEGPQIKFYRILDPIRQNFHICASGELMLVKRRVFERVIPVPPCMAEDSYILFKTIELGHRVSFCTGTFVTTTRTADAKAEEAYKTRTTLGILQALKYTKASPLIRVFYTSLPLTSPFLSLVGNDGRAWANGIRKAAKANITKKGVTKF